MKKKKIYSATALALAVCVCMLRPVISGAAENVDLTKPCSLTVHPDNGKFGEDLTSLDIVLDLYWVADAVKADGYDSYSYELTEPYQGLSVSTEMEAGEWRSVSQEAAQIALDEAQPDTPVVQGAPSDTSIQNLQAGLYLLVARGSDLEDYVLATESEDGTRIATAARSQAYMYTFEPELIALPSKEADPETGEVNTANAGGWIYDLTADLKVERQERFGSLEIVKTLLSYETREPAMFVFQIEAELDGQIVYSNVESLIFTEAGQKSVLIENQLPVGANVTVTEVYSGSSYTLTSEQSRTVQIAADAVVAAEFVNDYSSEQTGGHGILNRFSYENGTWDWTQDTESNEE